MHDESHAGDSDAADTSGESSAALLAYLDERVDKLHHTVPSALRDWDVESVHQARVTTRRLQAALKLLGPVVQKRHHKALGKPLRKLRKMLGPIRDADVMLHHLADMPGEQAAPANAWMTGLLRERRRRAEHELADVSVAKLLDRLGSWSAVRADAADGVAAIDCLLAESVHMQLGAFAEAADTLATHASASPPDCSDDTADPHQVRIAGKALRYTLELADAAGVTLPEGAAGTFKSMQDALGLWHDFVVLSLAVASAAVDHELALHDTPLHASAMDLSRQAADAAVKQLASFAEMWSSPGTALAARLRDALPLTRDVAEQPESDGSSAAAEGIIAPEETDSCSLSSVEQG